MTTTSTPPDVAAPAIRRPGPARRAANQFLAQRWASIILVAFGLMLYFRASSDVFLTESNIVTISQYVAATAIIASGMVLLLVSGEIDLSVGFVYTLAPFLMHYAVDFWHIQPLPAIAIALLISAGIGIVNGAITVLLKVPSFVTTLGMALVLSGITLTTSHAYPAQIPEEAQGKLQSIFGAYKWSEILWAIGIVIVFQILLSRTRWGLHTVSVGGNPVGAAEAGIKVARIKIGNFMMCSVLGALAGILEAFRVDSIDPSAGGYRIMFDAVAAAVIGGTALAGGSGTVIGAFLGMIVLGELRDGFNLIGVSAFTFDLILGLAILLAMISNVYLARLRRAGAT